MPHSADLVQRAVARLSEPNATVAGIARDLQVSENWVREVRRRVRQGESDGGHTGKPGGARFRVCTASNLARLIETLQEHPKWTLAQLIDRAMRYELKLRDGTTKTVSLFNEPRWYRDLKAQGEVAPYRPKVCTISRLLGRAGISFQAAQYVDPGHNAAMVGPEDTVKVVGMAERDDLRKKQKEPGHFLRDPKRLMFMDESTFYLTEQARRAWGSKNDPPKLNKPKNSYKSFTLMLTIAPGESPDGKKPFIVAELRNPEASPEEPLVLEDDTRLSTETPVAFSSPLFRSNAARPPHELNAEAMRDELRRLGLAPVQVELDPRTQKVVSYAPLDNAGLWARIKHVRQHGKVGLPIREDLRAAPSDKKHKKARISAETVAVYLRDSVVAAWTRLYSGDTLQAKADLLQRCLIWDNAQYHMPVKADSVNTVSWWHKYIKDLVGIGNVHFLPARSPGLNPCETVFAYIKRDVRANCPDSGQYESAQALKDAIDRAVAKITPDMILAWTRACGFGLQTRDDEAAAPARPRAPAEAAPLAAPAAKPRSDPACREPADVVRRHPVVCAIPNGRIVRIKPAHSTRWRHIVRVADDVGLRDVAGAVRREVEEAKAAARNQQRAAQQAPPALRRWVGPPFKVPDNHRKPVDLDKGKKRNTYLNARVQLLKRLNAERGKGRVTVAELNRMAAGNKWHTMPTVSAKQKNDFELKDITDVRRSAAGGRIEALVTWKIGGRQDWIPVSDIGGWDKQIKQLRRAKGI